jgi:hypothetical protein
MVTKNLKRVVKLGGSLSIVIDNKIVKSNGIREGYYVLYDIKKIYDENMNEIKVGEKDGEGKNKK